jgi:hypothetical protein
MLCIKQASTNAQTAQSDNVTCVCQVNVSNLPNHDGVTKHVEWMTTLTYTVGIS